MVRWHGMVMMGAAWWTAWWAIGAAWTRGAAWCTMDLSGQGTPSYFTSAWYCLYSSTK